MRILIILLISLILLSCNQEYKSKQKSKVNKDKDSSFVLLNVKNIDFIEDLKWDFDNLYYGESKVKKFEKLDNDLKIKYLYGFITGGVEGHKVDKEWLKMDMVAYIVAKQPKSENFQSVIIKVYGTDYSGLFLVNVKGNKVISRYPIYDLEISGPHILEDTLLVTRPKTFCEFKKNKLLIKKVTGTCKPTDKISQKFSVKEVNYIVTIDKLGQIKTVIKDIAQYDKRCKLEYFQTY